jgi:glycine oxidase
MQGQAKQQRVVVVGGGVTGCATAFDCALAGHHVTLIERDGLAAHASGKNAGNINPLIGTPAAQRPFALHAFALQHEFYAALRRLGGVTYTLAPVQRIHLAYDDSDCSHLEDIAADCATDERFPTRWLGHAALQHMAPQLAPARCGLLTQGSFSVSSSAFTQALAHGAARLRATLITGAVTGLRTRNGRVVGVEMDGTSLPCDALVLATGPWAGEAETWLGTTIPVSPLKGQMLRLRLPGLTLAQDFTWQSVSLYNRGHNELWVGGTMEHCGLDATPTAAAKHSLLEQAARLLPAVNQAELLAHTAALRPISATGACIAACAPGWENAYLANGGGAKGVLLSTGIARTIRRLLQDGPAPLPPAA